MNSYLLAIQNADQTQLWFEIILLSIIFLAQIYFVQLILKKLKLYKSIFNHDPEIALQENNEVDPDAGKENKRTNYQVVLESNNSITITIVDNINQYLRKNVLGFIDFNIIKDIIDRNSDNSEEEISNKIAAPLYLGLAGTMIGIIIGLWFLDLGNNGSGDVLEIDSLIEGVKWAMSVSVIGLLLTTILSVISFRLAKTKMNEGKNRFLSILQTELLPELVTTDEQAMLKLSGSMDRFSGNAPAFISDLRSAAAQVSLSVKNEIQLLKDFKKLDVQKLSEANKATFQELRRSMKNFEQFNEHYTNLNESLSETSSLNANLIELVSRTNDVNLVLQHLKDIVESGNEATTFFNAHIQSFENYGSSVERAVAKTDARMEAAISELGQAVTAQFEAFGRAAAQYDRTLSEAFENSITRFNEVYQNSVPKFDKLDQLDELARINERLGGLDMLNQSISDLNSKFDNQERIIKEQTDVLRSLKVELSIPDNLELKIAAQKKTIRDKVMEVLVVILGISVLGFILFQLVSKVI